jgi:integrase
MVYVHGHGHLRQDRTKTAAGHRTPVLPPFAVTTLRRRHDQAGQPQGKGPVFATRNGKWTTPNQLRTQWRQARKDAGLEWVTPHSFRRTVATLLDRKVDTRTAAAQLGH